MCKGKGTSGIDRSEGAKEEGERIVKHIRKYWPEVKIILRGDSGFTREELMGWCEANRVGYIFGLARNSRLVEEIKGEREEAQRLYEQTSRASRVYKDFS